MLNGLTSRFADDGIAVALQFELVDRLLRLEGDISSVSTF